MKAEKQLTTGSLPDQKESQRIAPLVAIRSTKKSSQYDTLAKLMQ